MSRPPKNRLLPLHERSRPMKILSICLQTLFPNEKGPIRALLSCNLSNLIEFCSFLVTLIALIIGIYDHNNKK